MTSSLNIVEFFIFCQALGACVGAVTAVWSELSYAKAMWNGKIDAAERSHLLIIGHGLRYGMTLLLLASLGLIVMSYLQHGLPQPALTSSYWSLMLLALLVISVASMLAGRRIPFRIGAATLFTAWWFLVYLSFGFITLSFGAVVMSLVVATVIFSAVISITHILVKP